MTTRRLTRAGKAAVEAASLPVSSTSSSNSKPIKATKPPQPKPRARSKAAPKPISASEAQTLSFPSASHFDAWLLQNSSTPSGIWLRFSKKAILAQVPSVSYLEAVDVSLCHGWIDGQRKALDENFYLQRFTPRRRRSLWSQRNVQRVEMLTAEGRMKPAGMAEVDAAKGDGRWEKAYAGPATMEVPKDLANALKENEIAQTAFESLSRADRYPFLWSIATVKRAETRERKIREFVSLLASNSA
ncbi:bacteriocin-protection, YdeI or OmpD-associated domain-containing protein [Trichoderma sp. SZMC 28014]